MTWAASDENVKNIISSYGSEIDLYNLPIVIGCFACEMESCVIIDPECAHPIMNCDFVFVLENLLKADPEAKCEVVLVAVPASDYPEPLMSIVEMLLEILSNEAGCDVEELSAYEQLFDTTDKTKLSFAIEKTFGVYISENQLASKGSIRDLANTIFLKNTMKS